jgi:UDP-N-acetylglucosamine--N-acetylmuramyl-(pentapeptide) pyrophosphoryl-undecaprenol N-acetylglucosamine transferase
MEKDLVEKEGFSIELITAAKIKGKSLVYKCMSLLRLPFIMKEAHTILNKYKPDIVLGMGGYASFMVVFVAKCSHYSVAIHEQNGVPGLANRILGRLVTRIFIAFPPAVHYFNKDKVIISGNPLRRKIIESIENETKDRELFRVFVTGGSQGARGINTMIQEALPLLSWAKATCMFIHQAGKSGAEVLRKAYESSGCNAAVLSFYTEMGEEYKRASLVISRSGAGIWEAAAHGKCMILIPFPHATDNHQYENARYFEEHDAADIILEGPRAHEKLAQKIRFYFDQPLERKRREKNSKTLARLDGAKVIVDSILSLVPPKEAYV